MLKNWINSKDVNGYSNIRIRSEYSNTISEFEYLHLFSVPAFFVICFTFSFFSSKFSNAKLRSCLERWIIKVGNLPH